MESQVIQSQHNTSNSTVPPINLLATQIIRQFLVKIVALIAQHVNMSIPIVQVVRDYIICIIALV